MAGDQSGDGVGSAIRRTFSNAPADGAVHPCPTWIELRFEPKPAGVQPNPSEPAGGEQTFKEKYRYELLQGGEVLLKGVLDLRRGGTIRHDDVSCGTCSFTLEMPDFATGVKVFWRKDWPQHHTVKKLTFNALATGKVHYFDIMNELPIAARYMADEMNKNAQSNSARLIRWQNEHSMGALAKLDWAAKVWPGQSWDHKPKFSSGQGSVGNLRAWHTWGEWEYYFDAWSNIHYGYVGRAAGFDRQTLIEGSNRSSTWDTGGNDAAQDKASMNLGMDLYEQGGAITPERLMREMESNPAFDRRPHSYGSATGSPPSIKKR
ncbi:polymorphic toxin type 44 domain-containing protein [Polyangium aurulentum]|uniref:polymorphic toxin type 44 domain-containing protein n=1 Tax=Polyangium aurulentum TaxID=2567896 RepID=UPI0010AEB97A|nr:polymorphic toxin type 44 domain-containing protein [Polyangium aurulentum]UQA60507.1 hypothetical protein E8A73_008560 [Polyangium aurulentum]